tara:strand:+ start:301 stop:750 length:450 start_codon:yes stop_codon:yes gene_type:complete
MIQGFKIMKTLNIAKIQSYKNITKSLIEKTNEIARFIEVTCAQNGIKSLLSGKYRLRSYKSPSCDYDDLELFVGDNYNDNYLCMSTKYIDSSPVEYIRNGDYNATYLSPSKDDIKTFINDINDIFADIERQVNGDTSAIDRLIKALHSK